MAKMVHFALELFIHPFDFSETFSELEENRYDYKINTACSGKTDSPRLETFVLKNAHFGQK